MAGIGPPPKQGEKLGHSTSPLDLDNMQTIFSGASSAPPSPPKRSTWHPMTERWWATWTDCPQAATFTQTDWNRLLMISHLVDRYNEMMEDPDCNINAALKLMCEVRQNETLLGATHLDRLRGRVKIEKPEKSKDEGQAALADYQNMFKD